MYDLDLDCISGRNAYRQGNNIYAHNEEEAESFLRDGEILWKWEVPLYGLYRFDAVKDEDFMPKEVKLTSRRSKRKDKQRKRWD
jgi:hypothetical protein